jgi:hypothetical protein
VWACRLALERAPELGFGRYIISATTPFAESDVTAVRADLPALIEERFPNYAAVYAARGWPIPDGIGRVYVNAAARRDLGCTPFAPVVISDDSGSDPPTRAARTAPSARLAADAPVALVDHASAEGPGLDQVQRKLSEDRRQERSAATDDDGISEHAQFVDEVELER